MGAWEVVWAVQSLCVICAHLQAFCFGLPLLQSITFDEFKAFCLFTNNLEDFAFTVKMISEANRPIGMGKVMSLLFLKNYFELCYLFYKNITLFLI